jgi:hypothetical protein
MAEYFNDSKVSVTKIINGKQVSVCPYYKRWNCMINRTYPSFHKGNPSYIGVSVCDEWKVFSRFKEWMELQDWEGKELDKDIICQGNKVYSPDFCCFVDKATNNLFTGRHPGKRQYPLGVSWSKRRKCYIAQCKNGKGKLSYVGGYNTAEEAHSAYLLCKALVVRATAERQTDDRVKVALLARAAIMEMELKPDKVSTRR